MLKRLTLVTSSLLALAAYNPALAQDAAAEAQDSETRDNGDIIVTATKIATNVQDVPIAITAVTAEALEEQQINTFSDLGNIVPNATFRKSQGIYGAGVQVTLRGIGQTDTQFSGEPAVAYYIDDVYYPFLFGSNFDLLDLDHVEVLRGPQGTLFGRNAISGAVNLVSKRPSFDDVSAYVDMTVGSFERLELRAGLNLPLTDSLAVAVSMVSKQRQGYMDALDFSCEMYRRGTPEKAGKFPFATPGTSWNTGRTPDSCVIDDYGGEDARAVRGALRWQPTPGVELNITADYSKSNDDVAAESVVEYEYQQLYGKVRSLDSLGAAWGPYTGVVDETKANRNFITLFDQYSIPGAPFRWDERFETGDIYKTYETFCDPIPKGGRIANNTMYNGSLYRGGACYGSKVPLTNWGVNGKLQVEITPEIEATAILGYRNIDTLFGSSWDGTPFVDSYIYHEDHMWYWTGEARLAGQHGWLDWVAGVFYYDGFADEDGRPQNTRLGTQQFQNVYYYPEAKAAYVNATVRPFDGLSISGGLRRSDDAKFVDYAALQDASVPGSTTFTASGTSTIFNLLISNKRWDWKLGADYRFSDDAMVYASASTGYRLPGFATRVFQVGQIQQQFPTTLVNYELGFKVDLFNRRLRLNGAAFWMAYSVRNGVFGGQEARFGPDGKTILAGTTPANTMTLIKDGPRDTDFAQDFSNCRPYNAATDGAPNGTTVGIQCITRQWNYQILGGDPVRGLELEATAEPIDDLVMNLSVGYTDRGSTTGRPVGFPDWTANGGIQYTAQVPAISGSLTPRLDWFYISSVAYSADYTNQDDPARHTFNTRLTYKNDDLAMDVAVGVTNLFDKQYFRQKTIFIQGLGAPANIGQPAPPREWYLSVSKRF